MSAMDYYKLNSYLRSVEEFNVSTESYMNTLNVSMESDGIFSKIITTVKAFFRKIIDFFKTIGRKILKAFKWIIGLFKSNKAKTKQQLDTLDEQDKTEVFANALISLDTGKPIKQVIEEKLNTNANAQPAEVNEQVKNDNAVNDVEAKIEVSLGLGNKIANPMYNSNVIKSVAAGQQGRTSYFIGTKDVIDLDQYNRNFDKYYNDLKELLQTYMGFGLGDSSVNPFDTYAYNNDYAKSHYNSILFDGVLIKSKQQLKAYKSLSKLMEPQTIDRLEYGVMHTLPTEFENIEKGGELVSNQLDKYIKYGINGVDPETIRIRTHCIRHASCIINVMKDMLMYKINMYNAIIGFYRMVSMQLNTGFAFSEPCPKGLSLYHLSPNPNLKSPMMPREIQSAEFKEDNGEQILPKRISFAPTIEDAFYGASFRIGYRDRDGNVLTPVPLGNGMYAVTYHVYKGITKKGVTRIKEKYTKHTIYDQTISNEICITSNIDIEPMGACNIYYTNEGVEYKSGVYGKKDRTSYKFVRYEFVS